MRDKRDREGVSGTELVKGLFGIGWLTNIKKTNRHGGGGILCISRYLQAHQLIWESAKLRPGGQSLNVRQTK